MNTLLTYIIVFCALLFAAFMSIFSLIETLKKNKSDNDS